MFIKDLVMWHHYNIILENSDITKRPWQRLAISVNWNLLSAYVIWNILVLNIKGKVNKIAIIEFMLKVTLNTHFRYLDSCMVRSECVVHFLAKCASCMIGYRLVRSCMTILVIKMIISCCFLYPHSQCGGYTGIPLSVRSSLNLVYVTSHLFFVGFYSYLVSWLAMIWACAYYTDFTDGWFLLEL
jgi:hypothetical protein